MKKEVLLVILLVTFLLPLASAGIINWFKDQVGLSPTQDTDVSITIENRIPTIDSVLITSPNPLILFPSPDTTPFSVSFFVSDQNGVDPGVYNDLDDDSASVTVTHSISTFSRSSSIGDCSAITIATQRRYDCTINMQYFDEPSLSGNPTNVWDIEVSISDLGGLSDTDSSTSFDINPSRHISINSPIFNPLVQGSQATTSTDTTITNNGNIEVPGAPPFENRIKVTPNDLLLGGIGPENIPSTSFLLGPDGIDVCSSGTLLTGVANQEITGLNLPRGLAGSNLEDMEYCVNVPLGIPSGAYTATVAGGNQWVILLDTP